MWPRPTPSSNWPPPYMPMPRSLAELVGANSAPQRPDARGLDVDHLRRERQRLDVGDGVDGRVPRDAVAVRLEDRLGLRRELRVLDPRVGERLDDAPVEHRVGGLVDDRADVHALEVDAVDGAGLDELGDQLLVPVGDAGRA